MEGGRDACYTYSNRYVHSLSPRHVERNYVSRRSIVSRRTRVRNYVRRDVDILIHPDSLTNKLPELVSKLVLSIPVKYFKYVIYCILAGLPGFSRNSCSIIIYTRQVTRATQ